MRRANWFCITLCSIATVRLLAEILIETPKSGWRNSSRDGMNFQQQVHYPASVVNTPEGQSKAALIQGKILGAKKQSEDPYTLIVNGIPMPIKVNGGIFERPYFFGSGSNGVEVRSPDSSERARVQFYEANPNTVKPALSVVLSWDTDQTDLDLHVVSPDGQHVWYGNRLEQNGGGLDVDVTTGYGPEIYSTPMPVKGTYLVYVNYYGSGPRSDLTLAQVTIINNQNTLDEKKVTTQIPMRKSGELTLVHSFVTP